MLAVPAIPLQLEASVVCSIAVEEEAEKSIKKIPLANEIP